MATLKLKFRYSSVPEAEGTLYYQLIHMRKVRWISTGYHIYPSEWNAGSTAIIIPEEGERRLDLLYVHASVESDMNLRLSVMHRMEASGVDFSIDDLCEAFTHMEPVKTLFPFLMGQVKKKQQMNRLGTAMAYSNAYRRFREFLDDRDLPFGALTPDLIERYEAWLTVRGMKQNTIRFYLRTLNTMLCRAVSEGITAERHLFRHVKLSYVNTAKRAISEKDLQKVWRLQLSAGSPLAFARDIFMFSFYMRGMPFVDIAYLKKSDLKSGMLTYRRKKTNQYLEIEWEPEQQAIVDRYTRQTGKSPYMFPIICREDGTEYYQYRRMQEKINRNLKKIGEMVGLKIPFTTYVARHTWASIARNMDFSIAIISAGMGHNSYKTTQIYLNSIDTSRINDANRKIIHRIAGKGSRR